MTVHFPLTIRVGQTCTLEIQADYYLIGFRSVHMFSYDTYGNLHEYYR